MKTPIEVPLDLILFIGGSICFYFGIREVKKYKERKKNASRFNEFGFIEDKWGYIDYQGTKNIMSLFSIASFCILALIIHLLEK